MILQQLIIYLRVRTLIKILNLILIILIIKMIKHKITIMVIILNNIILLHQQKPAEVLEEAK